MLCLSRKRGERLMIGDDIIITITAIEDNKVRLGIEAPKTTMILREELVPFAERPQAESKLQPKG